jgi:SRP40, C-terminal domain
VEVSSSSSSEDSDSSSDDSDSSSSEEEEEDAHQIAARHQQKHAAAAQRAQAATKAALEWRPPASTTTVASNVAVLPGSDGAQVMRHGRPYQRVDSDYWGAQAVAAGGALADNSYEATFGTDQGYGAKANAKLMTVQGKDFMREKNKRKRSFNGISRNGGQIDIHARHATKFEYASD